MTPPPAPPAGAPDAAAFTETAARPRAAACTCPGWHELGFCDKQAAAGDPPEFLQRITVNHARHELPGYDRACNRLAGQVGHQDARKILRAAVNAAIEAKLAADDGRESPATPEPAVVRAGEARETGLPAPDTLT